ncbi:hypothetical protein, partial [Vibrio parahaemolyticus]|uniref:hypothetical protein n=1 Tax=Vibrio parahaemolyticus TaxID=670 RepID=UPI002269C816
RKMFTSEKWCDSRWTREAKGKRVTKIVLMPSFWNNIVYILKVTGPLVKVFRLVDSEKRPVMGYIYEAMDRCKEAIMKAFNNNTTTTTNCALIPLCEVGHMNPFLPSISIHT